MRPQASGGPISVLLEEGGLQRWRRERGQVREVICPVCGIRTAISGLRQVGGRAVATNSRGRYLARSGRVLKRVARTIRPRPVRPTIGLSTI